MASHFNCLFSISVESGVASGVLGLEDVDSLGLALFVSEVVFRVELGVELEESSLLHGDSLSSGWSSSGGVIIRVLGISSSGIWSSGSWVGVIVGHGSWLNLSAWGSRLSILGSISTIAIVSGTVNAIGTVGSVAEGKLTWLSLNDNWVPLSVMEWLSLHGNILTEVLITSHTFGKLNHLVFAGDSLDLV